MRILFFRGKFNVYREPSEGEPRRISLRTADRDEAERRFADYQAALKRSATTVAEITEDYLADRGPRIAGLATARFNLKAILPAFGHLRPDQVNRANSREYVTLRREQGRKDSTIRRELAVLSAALHWANKQTPAIIEMPPQPPPKSGHLTRVQYRAFREASKQVFHLHTFVVLAYSTGGRASAVLDLKWETNIDFGRGLIHLGIPGEKRQKGRATVPMTDGLRAVLEEARKAAVTDYVVEYGGKRVLSVKRAFKACSARAGLPKDTSPNILRHSCAVHLAESGVDLIEISRYLGHSNTLTTYRVYAVHSPQYLKKAAMALE